MTKVKKAGPGKAMTRKLKLEKDTLQDLELKSKAKQVKGGIIAQDSAAATPWCQSARATPWCA